MDLIVSVGRRIFLPPPQPPQVEPIPEDVKRRVNQEEATVRAELVRAQSEALRFRVMAGDKPQ
jgi:hypothetical protein